MRPAALTRAADGHKPKQNGESHAASAFSFVRVLLPLAAVAAALGAAIVGALLTGTTAGSLTAEVEGISSSGSGILEDVSAFFPLGFAFGAGMVSAVNPCGFTMLPAYLGLYLGQDAVARQNPRPVVSQFTKALVVGASVTAGFTLLFAVVGLAVGAGAQVLVDSFAWIGLSIGVLLVLAGAWLLYGGSLYSALGGRLAARIGDPSRSDFRGYFLFGLSYGTASLSCTLPIFLTVVGGSVAVANLIPSLGQFILYGLGMGAVIMTLTISMAVFKAALVGWLRRALPYIHHLSTVLLLAAGGYIVYYWLTFGELLETFV